MMRSQKHYLIRTLLTLCTCVLLFSSVDVDPVRAETLTVTTFVDEFDGICDSHCSLRDAIYAANSYPEPSTIVLPAGTYTLTRVGYDDDGTSGDLDIFADTIISGIEAGLTIIDAQAIGDRIFDIHNSSDVTISGVSIVYGGQDQGGGIKCANSTLTLQSVIVRQNTALVYGGGIYSDSCNLLLDHTWLAANSAYGGGGGGIYLLNSELEISESLISGNSTEENSAGGGVYCVESRLNITESRLLDNISGTGGGIYAIGDTSMVSFDRSLAAGNLASVEGGGVAMFSGRSLTITNSTISGNAAIDYGGGINTRVVTSIAHSTITENVADADSDDYGNAGGIFCYSSGCAAEINQTIIAHNIDQNALPYHDCMLLNTGSLISIGFNLVESTGNCVFDADGDIIGPDPQLGPLRDNGGPTHTHALMYGSPAIDAGNPVAPPPVDQRGFTRPLDGDGDGIAICDIGAFETVRLWGSFLPLLLR